MSESTTAEAQAQQRWQRLPAVARPVYSMAKGAGYLSSISLVVLAGIVVLDVIMRALSDPLSGGSDIGAMLMVALIFFAVSGTQVDHDHVSMDALIVLFPKWLRKITDKVNLFVCLVVGGFLTYGTWKLALKSFRSGEMALGAMHLPLWPGKTIVAIGLTLYTLVVLAQFLGADLKPDEHDSMPAAGTD